MSLFETDEELKLIEDLIRKSGSIKEAEREWCSLIGLSRASFYRKKYGGIRKRQFYRFYYYYYYY